MDSLSKRYSACGIRLGCLATRNRDDLPGGAADGAGPPLAAGPGAVRRGRDERSPGRLHGARSWPSTRSGGTSLYDGLRAIPGVVPDAPGRGLLLRGAACPSRTARTSRAGCSRTSSATKRTVMVAPASGFYATPGARGERGPDRLRAQGRGPARRRSASWARPSRPMPAAAGRRRRPPPRPPRKGRTSTRPPRAEDSDLATRVEFTRERCPRRPNRRSLT